MPPFPHSNNGASQQALCRRRGGLRPALVRPVQVSRLAASPLTVARYTDKTQQMAGRSEQAIMRHVPGMHPRCCPSIAPSRRAVSSRVRAPRWALCGISSARGSWVRYGGSYPSGLNGLRENIPAGKGMIRGQVERPWRSVQFTSREATHPTGCANAILTFTSRRSSHSNSSV